ncbi:hypothetical protein AAZX31_02G254000 [Glycine max]|uniref:CLE22 protein n=2 Tax=Glycine subgen. Soja TaxID=1462606 RepID=E9L568_SOYBN|nr:CLE22 protein [Glycine max]KAG5053176.1 hypothetical protein JHK87_005374 [Glycine soja]KAG5064509.1 hypothetical protein JHK85_005692 [Glycine max]KAG5081470.1 hypothetical protein JHK86_005535 [Glycine max]KAH1062310.1 hypothetical protein GYH30_005350 [Glycine max]
MNMKHFHLFFLLTLLFLTPRIQAIRIKYSGPSTLSQQDFHPWANSPISSSREREYMSEKRRVPTGSNPLHNKR